MKKETARATFRDIVASAPTALRPVCRALREVIAACAGPRAETAWPRMRIASFGIGPRKMTEHYAYVGVQGSHVNLGFYHGASLEDPDGLLEGAGKALRHVKVRSVREARAPALARLVRGAVAERRGRKA